jgi:hypothetical protein
VPRSRFCSLTYTHTHNRTHTHVPAYIRRYALPALYRIDCVGCQHLSQKDPGFASGVICAYTDNRTNDRKYRLCNSTQGDSTTWNSRTLELLARANDAEGFSSGALRGVCVPEFPTETPIPRCNVVHCEHLFIVNIVYRERSSS